MIKTVFASLKILFFAVALSALLIMVAGGCSGDKSGGADPYGESSSSLPSSGKVEDEQDDDGLGSDEEIASTGSQSNESDSLSQDEALEKITDQVKVPIYKVNELSDEFRADKQLPNKDNPEIIISEGEEAAQLTLTDRKGATVVLTFNIKGDIGDVDTSAVEIAGVTGLKSKQSSDKGDLIIYSWSIGSGESGVPYTLQLIGFSEADADKLKNSLTGL